MRALLGVLVICILGLLGGAESAGLVVDATGNAHETEGKAVFHQCLKRRSQGDSSEDYETLWDAIPSYRILGLCPQNSAMVGMLVEMQAHFSFLYTASDGQFRCQIVTVSSEAQKPSSGMFKVNPRNATRTNTIAEAEEKNYRNQTSTIIVSEKELTYCDNRTRKMGIYLDPVDGGSPWVLEMTWRRRPEYYEEGEVGWSSVGAHIGALSGTFSLTEVRLAYLLASFPNVKENLRERRFVAEVENMERFRARAGDFYQCVSSRHILLTALLNDSQTSTPPPPPTPSKTKTQVAAVNLNDTNALYAVFTTRNIRLQSFSDDDLNSFTGAGVTCGDDIHEDHTVTIGIGSAVSVVVVISMLGIVLTRLYDRDRELQSYEAEYCKMTDKGLLAPVPKVTRNYEMKPIGRGHRSPA